MKRLLFILGVLCAAYCEAGCAPAVTTSPRERLLFDFGWRFHQGDPSDVAGTFAYPEPGRLDKTRLRDLRAWATLDGMREDAVAKNLGGQISFVQPEFDDHDWRQLDLPHDWAVELPFDPDGDQSHGRHDINISDGTNIGWYRRTFELPASDQGKRINVCFDGVYRKSLVWVNGQCLGRFRSGYTSFQYDITKHVKFGSTNTIVVRADATRDEGWFYEGAGIYRHVWLVKTDTLHVATWGTFVTTEVADDGKNATLTVRTTLRNDADAPAAGSLQSAVVDPDGKQVADLTTDSTDLPGSGGENEVVQKITLADPRLWSIESPTMYKLVSTVKRSGTTADVYETPFGIRTIRFDANEGFFLNGKRVEIKGTCNHQDHAGVGAALPDRLQVFRIEKLKEMGSNAYRTSHNPPTPELLDACDRLGMLVMDENRRMDARPDTLADFTALIKRDRNHPSVIIWSIGNEEGEMHGSEKEGAEIARTLQDLAHKLDPTRLVTYAHNGGGRAWSNAFAEVLDVMGCNYFNQSRKNLDEFHAAHPQKLVIGTEEASTLCTRGEYARDPKKAFMPAYDLEAPRWGTTAERWWKFYVERPWLSGAFVWTGFDYRGEPTPYNFALSSQFGIMDTCGFPKDNFYYYQAWWSDKPVLHVFPHWNWSGREGQDIDVWVHSNYDEVELLLNGESLGRKPMPRNSHLEWKVKYAPVALIARGFKQGNAVEEKKVETIGAPVAVKLISDRATIDGNGEDVTLITVAVMDEQGRIVPTANNEVHFDIRGPGRIIGVGNGHPNTTESDKLPQRRAFNGLAQVIVQSTRQPGTITLNARSEGLRTATVELHVKDVMPRPSVR